MNTRCSLAMSYCKIDGGENPFGQNLITTSSFSIAPLALFNTELLNLTGAVKLGRTQATTKTITDPEDCFDKAYLREIGTLVR